jgi:hypothetical protein
VDRIGMSKTRRRFVLMAADAAAQSLSARSAYCRRRQQSKDDDSIIDQSKALFWCSAAHRMSGVCVVMNGIGTLLPPPESHQKTKVRYDLTKVTSFDIERTLTVTLTYSFALR